MHKACGFGQLACVKKLFECGASLDAVDNSGNTALHLASQLGFEFVISYLMSKGAKTDIVNGNGKTPLDVALDSSIEALFNKAS
mmetsp:Transcript_21019/g.27343  ORF Transcript_21019/g.27343 Transcript_21019/m.27343 type:complete len:84 (-) Transcript_21019:340-591(-)